LFEAAETAKKNDAMMLHRCHFTILVSMMAEWLIGAVIGKRGL
jgi:hypothetical protein